MIRGANTMRFGSTSANSPKVNGTSNTIGAKNTKTLSPNTNAKVDSSNTNNPATKTQRGQASSISKTQTSNAKGGSQPKAASAATAGASMTPSPSFKMNGPPQGQNKPEGNIPAFKNIVRNALETTSPKGPAQKPVSPLAQNAQNVRDFFFAPDNFKCRDDVQTAALGVGATGVLVSVAGGMGLGAAGGLSVGGPVGLVVGGAAGTAAGVEGMNLIVQAQEAVREACKNYKMK
jgi:hypothetical protein